MYESRPPAPKIRFAPLLKKKIKTVTKKREGSNVIS